MAEWLTCRELAKELKVSATTPGVWIKRGVLPPRTYLRLGRTIRFNRESLEKFLLGKENRTKAKNFKD